MFNNVFKNLCLFWVNVEKYIIARQAKDYNKILRLQYTCWITKATDSNSEYVTLITLPRQHWLRECASVLHLYVHWMSCHIFMVMLFRFCPDSVLITFVFSGLLHSIFELCVCNVPHIFRFTVSISKAEWLKSVPSTGP